ncbi:MAG: hypothetical protein AAGA20_07220 [Planctomycetota bacterium]
MTPDPQMAGDLEAAVRDLGARLAGAFAPLVEAAGGPERGTQHFAERFGVDKVLASRLLKALRAGDDVARLHFMPGPEPLRRVVRGVRRRLDLPGEVLDEAGETIDAFETFLADAIGDRSALTTLLAAWSPEVRAEFEVRRKQAAWRALSELRGASVDLAVSAVVFEPAKEPDRLDVTWVLGLIGLRRLRPGVTIQATTRRVAPESAERRPIGLDGAPLDGLEDGRLDAFCTSPPGRFEAHRTGDLLRYTLADEGYGPDAEVDLLVAEVNEGEMRASVPRGSGRRGWVYADTPVPARKLVLDVFVHEDVYPGSDPELLLYDTALQGVADVNDPSRDMDRLDLVEEVCPMGRGIDGLALREFEPYGRLLAHVFDSRALERDRFRAYRVAIDHPLHGMQVAVAFEPPEN